MDTTQIQVLRIVFGAVIVLGFVIFYFVYTFIKQQKKITAWQQERIKAEIDTLENERKRIAADLHDELGPMLSAVKLQVNHLEIQDETEKSLLQKSSGQIDEIIRRFREISYDLLPNTLVRKGLVKATEEFISKMSASNKLNIQFSCSSSFAFSKEKEINIYRIIQEIMHNTIKHANASSLKLSFAEEKEYLVIKTSDDGTGFINNQKNKETAGLGLMNIESRVSILNGTMLLQSDPGKGTSFLIRIPL